MSKNKKLNVIRGGVAKQIPGMPNYYFMKGLPHELGGIDIGKDLEVENNEVVHVGKDNIKVYSSVPFLNGVSPAEKVLGGDNPTTVFKEQEQFKSINGLKDDGTKKELGGKDEIVPDNTKTNKILSKRDLFPTYRDYVKNKQKERFANYVSTIGPTKGRSQGLINVYPEFDLLTLGRGLVTDPINIGGLIKNKYKNYKIAKELYKDVYKTNINTNNHPNKVIFADNLNKSNPDFINSADFLIERARTNNPVNKRYFNAIKNKDYEELQSVVDEVFKLRTKDNKVIDVNGNPISSWHTVRKTRNPNYNVFDTGTGAIYTTPDRFMSNSYYSPSEFISHRQKNKIIDILKKEYPNNWEHYQRYINMIPVSSNGRQYEKHLFTYMKNPKTIDAQNSYWGRIPLGNSGRTFSTNDLEDIFRNTKHDGVIIKNVKDWGDGGINVPTNKIPGKDVYISYTPNQVKSADLITYDDKGNIIPITERFNFNKKDYRYATIPAIATGTTITNMNKKQLGGKMNNKTNGLYSLTVDGQTKLHQFPSTGESFARSAKGKVIAKLGTEKRNKQALANTHNRLKKGITPIIPTINTTLDDIVPISVPADKAHKRRVAVQRIKNKINKSLTSDNVALASNVIGSVISHGINKSMLNDLEYSPKPITRRANKLKTKININPQIDAMRESLAEYRQHINDNTASSRTARALMNRGLSKYVSGVNTIYANKENQETDLINKDRLNQQEVTNANIADYNNWKTNKVNFDNSVREKKSENDIGLISNINAGIQDIISRGEKRFNERQNRLALMAANPNVNPLLLRDFGIEGITDENIRNYYKVHGNKNKKR